MNYLNTVGHPSADYHPVPLWQTADEHSGLGIIIASCADLGALQLTHLPTCETDQPVLAASYLTDLPPSITVGHTTIDVPSAPPRFTAGAGVDGLGTDLVVNPAFVTQQDLQTTRSYRILAATTTVAQSNLLAVAAAGTLPGSTTRLLAAELKKFNEPVTEARRIVNGLLLVTLILAAASVITATIGRAINRGPTYSRLRAAGTPVAIFTRALFLETCVVLLLAVACGLATGSLVARALVATLGGVFSPSTPLTLWIVAAGMAIPIVATISATPTMKRASDLKFMTEGPQG